MSRTQKHLKKNNVAVITAACDCLFVCSCLSAQMSELLVKKVVFTHIFNISGGAVVDRFNAIKLYCHGREAHLTGCKLYLGMSRPTNRVLMKFEYLQTQTQV